MEKDKLLKDMLNCYEEMDNKLFKDMVKYYEERDYLEILNEAIGDHD